MTEQNDDKDLVIAALRQRVGELVSSYEYHIATIRAEATRISKEYDHLLKLYAEDEETKKLSLKKEG